MKRNIKLLLVAIILFAILLILLPMAHSRGWFYRFTNQEVKFTGTITGIPCITLNGVKQIMPGNNSDSNQSLSVNNIKVVAPSDWDNNPHGVFYEDPERHLIEDCKLVGKQAEVYGRKDQDQNGNYRITLEGSSSYYLKVK